MPLTWKTVYLKHPDSSLAPFTEVVAQTISSEDLATFLSEGLQVFGSEVFMVERDGKREVKRGTGQVERGLSKGLLASLARQPNVLFHLAKVENDTDLDYRFDRMFASGEVQPAMLKISFRITADTAETFFDRFTEAGIVTRDLVRKRVHDAIAADGTVETLGGDGTSLDVATQARLVSVLSDLGLVLSRGRIIPAPRAEWELKHVAHTYSHEDQKQTLRQQYVQNRIRRDAEFQRALLNEAAELDAEQDRVETEKRRRLREVELEEQRHHGALAAERRSERVSDADAETQIKIKDLSFDEKRLDLVLREFKEKGLPEAQIRLQSENSRLMTAAGEYAAIADRIVGASGLSDDTRKTILAALIESQTRMTQLLEREIMEIAKAAQSNEALRQGVSSAVELAKAVQPATRVCHTCHQTFVPGTVHACGAGYA